MERVITLIHQNEATTVTELERCRDCFQATPPLSSMTTLVLVASVALCRIGVRRCAAPGGLDETTGASVCLLRSAHGFNESPTCFGCLLTRQ